MPTLLDTQRAMFHALVLRDGEGAASQIIGDALSPAERLDIYRNTFFSGLTTALRISYPAVQRLVGEEFFGGAAQRFIEAHPPQTAYLNAYGAEFADFLAQFQPAASLPYLADVARLEWAVNVALHAENVAPLDADTLASIANVPPEHLVLIPHPSVALLQLDYPATAIWRAVLSEDDSALDALDLSAGPEWVMVERAADGIEVIPLAESEWRFTAALCAGQTFAKGVEAASDADIPLLFAQHLAAGRFNGFRLAKDYLSAPSEKSP
jgi:hypothetical protein